MLKKRQAEGPTRSTASCVLLSLFWTPRCLAHTLPKVCPKISSVAARSVRSCSRNESPAWRCYARACRVLRVPPHAKPILLLQSRQRTRAPWSWCERARRGWRKDHARAGVIGPGAG